MRTRARGCLVWGTRGLAATFGAVYLAASGAFWWYQEALVYLPPDLGAEVLHQVARDRGTRELTLPAPDGTALLAWHQRDGGDRLVLFFSGNGEALTDYVPFHDVVREAGFDLLTVAWRGYPGSPGTPSQPGLVADAHTAWDWAVTEGGYDPARIVVHGRSLGGGVAGQLIAGGARPGGLVLESTFGKLRWVLAGYVPGLPYALLLRSPFDTVALAPTLDVPTLVLASAGDTLIPPDVGGRVLAGALPDARYLEVSGLSHQDDLPVSSPEVRAAWRDFVERQVPLAAP